MAAKQPGLTDVWLLLNTLIPETPNCTRPKVLMQLTDKECGVQVETHGVPVSQAGIIIIIVIIL